MTWQGKRRKQLHACPTCAFEQPVEVTTFTDWYHQWLCPACGKEWRGEPIHTMERELRRGELG